MHIKIGDFDDPRVVDLLQFHTTTARAQTAPGSAHALDLLALQSPDIGFWTIWDDNSLLGIGALKTLSPDLGEVKSMHTVKPREAGESAASCFATLLQSPGSAAWRA